MLHSKKFWPVCLGLIVLASAPAWAASAVATTEIQLREVKPEAYLKFCLGIELSMSNQPAEAQTALEEALQLDPESSEVHRVLARVFRQLGQNARAEHHPEDAIPFDSKAMAHMEEAVRLAPDDSRACWELGLHYLMAKNKLMAKQYLEKAATLDPENLRFQADLANLFMTQFIDLPSALKYMQAALKTRAASSNAEITANLTERIAGLCEALGQVDDALGWYRKLVRYSPAPATVHAKIAQLLESQGKVGEAIEELLKAREETPGYTPISLALAKEYVKQQDWDKAGAELKKYVAEAPDDQKKVTALFSLMDVAKKLNKADDPAQYRRQAIELLKKITADAPDTGSIAQVGALLYEDGQYEEAATYLLKAADTVRGDDAFKYRRFAAEALEKAKKLPEAEAQYRRLLTDFPNNYRSALLLAEFLKAHDRLPEAIEVVKQALTTVPKEQTVQMHSALASFYEEGKKYEEAEAELDAAFAIDPDSPDTNNQREYMYAERGIKLDEAVELVQKALAKDPDNGAYLDSLAWAYFKLGRFPEALAEITKAVNAFKEEPDAVVLEHYGDILWAVGTREQAKEQWAKALVAAPDSREGIDVEALKLKIEKGLQDLPKAEQKPPNQQ